MTPVYLEKRDPALNMRRYYRIAVTPTLFGDVALVREWGRIGQRGGQRMEEWFTSEAEADAAGVSLAQKKRGKGYTN